MADLKSPLDELGEHVARISDRALDPSARAAVRRRLLSAPIPGHRRRPRGALVALVGLLAAICVAASLTWCIPPEGPALSFELGSPPAPGAVGQWVGPSGDERLEVRFSEGSTLTIAPRARLRVTETSPHGAAVLIERGTVHAVISPRRHGARWTLRAGPFEVLVTGTTFDADWEPASERFELVMKEGSVVVTGPLLPPGRVVVAGESLVIAVREERMELRSAAAEPSVAPVIAPQPLTTASPSAQPSQSSAAPSPSGSARAHVTSAWRELALAGKYREAFDAADRSGFAREIERASARDLLTLSDTARFAGRPAEARQALLAMRKRFGARGRSAFLLGKIAADNRGDSGEAVTWFETYLAEEPGGPLAEQALGRILEIRQHGDAAAARAVAERYLARYPNGTYAALARRLSSP